MLRKIKSYIPLMILPILLFTTIPAFAQESNISAPITIQPDSPLYGIDIAIDNIRLAITSNNFEKAKIGLEVAEERLLEVKLMISVKKFDHAQIAKLEHNKMLIETDKAVANLEIGNNIQELKEKEEIKKRVSFHKDKIKTVEKELEIEIKLKGDITVKQQMLVDELIASMEELTGKLEIEIENEKGETKIEIKMETGKTDAEINHIVKIIEDDAIPFPCCLEFDNSDRKVKFVSHCSGNEKFLVKVSSKITAWALSSDPERFAESCGLELTRGKLLIHVAFKSEQDLNDFISKNIAPLIIIEVDDPNKCPAETTAIGVGIDSPTSSKIIYFCQPQPVFDVTASNSNLANILATQNDVKLLNDLDSVKYIVEPFRVTFFDPDPLSIIGFN